MSRHCLFVFTFCTCSSEWRGRRAPAPRVYTGCFLCGCLGACEGKDTADTDQSNINTEQWTVEWGGRSALQPQCWDISVSTIQERLIRTPNIPNQTKNIIYSILLCKYLTSGIISSFIRTLYRGLLAYGQYAATALKVQRNMHVENTYFPSFLPSSGIG